jgi:hypothetical protein
MAELRTLFRNASLTLVDVLLVAYSAAALAYLSVPLRRKLSTALGPAVEPNKRRDIQAVAAIVFLGVFLFTISAVFCASILAGCLVFARLPSRARWFTRIGLIVLLMPVFVPIAKSGPRGYFNWATNPSIRDNQANQKSKSELQRTLKESAALSVERQSDGIRIANHTDPLVRLQVAFIPRLNESSYQCYPGRSLTFPHLQPMMK